MSDTITQARKPISRSEFDRFLWERDISNVEAAKPGALDCSPESVRRWRLPLDHPEFRSPPREVLTRIVAFTDGMITGEAFIPLHLRRQPPTDAPAGEVAA